MKCEYKTPDHTFLYIFVFVIMLSTCSIQGDINRLSSTVEKLQTTLTIEQVHKDDEKSATQAAVDSLNGLDDWARRKGLIP